MFVIVQGISSKMAKKEFSIFIIFLMQIHVFILCRNFELFPIKIGFVTNFLSCSKIGSKTLYYSTWTLAKFRQNWLGENSPVL